jgi:hypothetical protein
VLHHLAERPGRLTTEAELLHAVWADTAVTDWVLTNRREKATGGGMSQQTSDQSDLSLNPRESCAAKGAL